jgi:transcriptional regulator with XRE-family HTH domain
MELARRIKTIRMAKGLTQQDAAEAMGVSQATYSTFERKAGNCSFYTIIRIAEGLGVSIPFLVDVQSDKFIEKEISKIQSEPLIETDSNETDSLS